MYRLLNLLRTDLILLLLLLILVAEAEYFIASFTQKIYALTMTNSNFILQMGNLNSFAGKPTGSGFKLSDTGGQTGAGLYSGPNYKIRSGFQYISSIIRFRFTISSQFIDFGTLTSSNPVTRTQTLTVKNGSAYGYAVSATENHALIVPSKGSIIPDTTCDSGGCTHITAAAWTSFVAYGFGYRCDNAVGSDCSTDFLPTYYKQFANTANSEAPQTVMSSTNVGANRQATITYKVNISATQPPGDYTNIVNFVATPTF